MSRASECAVLALCHRAAFICALQASGIILPDDSWVANRTGFIKNVLELFVISIGCGKSRGEKKWEEKILLLIQLNCVTGSAFCCWFSIWRQCWKQTEPLLRKFGFLKWCSLGTGAYLYREIRKAKWQSACRFAFLESVVCWRDTLLMCLWWNGTRIVALPLRNL